MTRGEGLGVKKGTVRGSDGERKEESEAEFLTTNGIAQWGDSVGAVSANGLHG